MKKDINFFYEIGSLRKIPRAWQQILTGQVQNISEHTFRTTMIAWAIAIKEKADAGKVIRMSLLHDIAETRTGDIAFMHRDYVERKEDLANSHIFENTILESEARVLIKEYEERVSLEAKIVKDADNLDVDLELRELSKMGDPVALQMQRDHRPIVRGEKLYTKTAKKIWDEIQKIKPDEWHQNLSDKWLQNKNGAK